MNLRRSLRHLTSILLVLIVIMTAKSTRAETRAIRIGIPSIRGPEQTLKSWQETADYLSTRINGYRFIIIPLNIEEIEQTIENGKLEFALVSPSRYVYLSKKSGAQHLATLIRKAARSQSSQLGSVIFTRNERSDIATIADLKGKSLMATHENAFAGWHIAQHELARQGISPAKLKAIQFSGYPVDKVVLAVRNGSVDAGVVRTDTLEQMALEGKIDLAEFKIINRQETSGFPFLHSSQLYPEYCFIRTHNADEELSRKVAAQLLLYPGDAHSPDHAGIAGWAVPASNESVRTLMQTLKLPPYENFGKTTLKEALRQHWFYLTTMAVALTLLTLLIFRLKFTAENVKLLLAHNVNNAKYRALFEDAGDYLLVLAPATENSPPVIIDANNAAFTKHGYTREELIGQPIFILDTPAAIEKNRDIGRSMSIGGDPVIFESEHICKDGSTFPVEVSARLIEVPGGEPIILAIERDITERKCATEALRLSEERFRVLFDKITNISVQGYAPDGTVRFWNHASEELYGYTAAEAVGKNLLELIIPPDMHDEVRNAICFMFDSGEAIPASELTLMRKNGSMVQVYSNHTVLEITGVGKELYCIDLDLSSLKQAEQQIEHLNLILRTLRSVDKLILQEKDPKIFIERTCRLLIEHRGYLSAMIVITDQDWTPDLFSHSRLSDNGNVSILTEPPAHLPLCCQEAMRTDGALLINAHNPICSNCEEVNLHHGDIICMALCYEGRHFGCIKAISGADSRIDPEEILLFEGMAADIAFALHSMKQQVIMGHVMAEKDFIEAEMRQAQKMEAIGRLAGGIAHDFNNKLTVILCGAEMALTRTTPDIPLYHDLINIKKAGEQSAALTQQLLAFSRKQPAKAEIVCLNEYITTELEILSRMIREDITIQFTPTTSRTDISIDKAQLDQILANLAVNASDSIEGSGVITIETAVINIKDGELAQLKLPSGDYVLLTFRDNGSGIDGETLEKIFDPFFTTKPEGQGTGLGLSTVYGIIKQHHGAISVTSEENIGTCFYLYFPLNADCSAVISAEAERSIPVGEGTILVVEDTDQILELISMILSDKGYRVLTAASPDKACRLSAEYADDIHLLLTDIVMPEMNGRELQANIEAHRPGIKTIFMSGYTSEIIAVRSITQENVHFLPKPFRPGELHHMVHLVLHGE